MLTGYFIIGLAGVILGGVGVKIASKQKPEPVEPVIIAPVDPVGEVAKQLTNLDLLVEPCSKEYIESAGDTLCREMYCRVMTRGVDSKTSGAECEEISNVANSTLIINHCETFLEHKEECYEKYRERK